VIEDEGECSHLADDDLVTVRDSLGGDASHAEDGGFGRLMTGVKASTSAFEEQAFIHIYNSPRRS
jgi:hypothetical protein